jgi:hypothetical protein
VHRKNCLSSKTIGGVFGNNTDTHGRELSYRQRA